MLGQLGNRIQHALRAYTPEEQKSIRAAASSFRENPSFDTEEVITDLGVGEALVSMLDAKGVPGIVGRTLIRPPASRLGPATASERKAMIAASDLRDKYEETIDRESAYEQLEGKAAAREKEEAKAEEKEVKAKAKAKPKKKSTRKKDNVVVRELKREGKLMLRRAGRNAIRGILGSMMRR